MTRFLILFVSILLMAAACAAQSALPGTLLAVSLYKAHLLSLGGWGGYWLDRALFPYARPHELLDDAQDAADYGSAAEQHGHYSASTLATVGHTLDGAGLRRAIVVAACLLCVGLGA